MNAIEILRAASRSVPNEDYVQFMAAVEAVEAVESAVEALEETLRPGGMYDKSVVHSQGAMQDEMLALGRKIKDAIAKAKGEQP